MPDSHVVIVRIRFRRPEKAHDHRDRIVDMIFCPPQKGIVLRCLFAVIVPHRAVELNLLASGRGRVLAVAVGSTVTAVEIFPLHDDEAVVRVVAAGRATYGILGDPVAVVYGGSLHRHCAAVATRVCGRPAPHEARRKVQEYWLSCQRNFGGGKAEHENYSRREVEHHCQCQRSLPLLMAAAGGSDAPPATAPRARRRAVVS
eukprot:SAG31_NODE_83_length_27039_cov_14.035746_1_plen_201_part_10